MKYQKILIALAVIIVSNSLWGVAGKIWKSPDDIGFEFKNKGPSDITFSLVQTKPSARTLVNQHHLSPNGQTFSQQLDIQASYELQVNYKTKRGTQESRRYRIKPGKTIFITWEDEKIRPQRGTGICPSRVSDSGFNLSRNVTNADVRQITH